MPIPTTSVFSAEIQMQGVAGATGSDAKNIANVFHYRRTTSSGTLSKTALNTAFVAGPVAALLAALNVRYTQTQNVIRWLDDADDIPLGITQAGVGAVTGDATPLNEAVYMLLRTATRGRSYRGSKHFAPLSESDSVGDLLAGTGLTRWQAVQVAIAANLTDANGNVWVPQVFSRTLSQISVNPTNVVTNAVVSVALNKRIGTMKKRKVRSVY